MDVMVAEALASIPGWEDASAEALPGGQTNHSWLVTAGEQKAVLKVDAKPRGAPYNTRQREARLQSLAADHGLAGRVLFAGNMVYLSEYLEGVVWSRECFADAANIAQLGVALRRLHSLPLTGRSFDALGAARTYAGHITSPDEARVADCLQTIAAVPLESELCFCHNDLVADNIINAPDTRFLDWEYACDNDPFFDLATLTTHHVLNDEQIDALLDAYFEGDGARWHKRLERQAGVYAALLYLWEQARLPAVP